MTLVMLVIVAILLLVGYASGSTSPTAVNVAPNVAPNPTPPGAAPTGVDMSNSDGSLTGSFITANPSTWPGATPNYPDAACWNICAAVALAEGYSGGSGVAPYDLNNPGDLSPGDEAGQATAGPAQYHGGSNVIVFATAEGGWIALYTKFENIRTGNSAVYPVTYTWAQVAQIYAGNSAAWLSNVTSYLGVDPSSTPAQYGAS
jgi:hypothetical protein